MRRAAAEFDAQDFLMPAAEQCIHDGDLIAAPGSARGNHARRPLFNGPSVRVYVKVVAGASEPALVFAIEVECGRDIKIGLEEQAFASVPQQEKQPLQRIVAWREREQHGGAPEQGSAELNGNQKLIGGERRDAGQVAFAGEREIHKTQNAKRANAVLT